MAKVYSKGCTGVAVIKDEKLLLGLRRDGQGWCLAGGKQEANETLEECGYRELKEEFGLEGKDIRYLGTVKSEVTEGGRVISVEPSIYLCQDYTGTIEVKEDEILKAQWVDLNAALEIENLFPPSREAIKLILHLRNRS